MSRLPFLLFIFATAARAALPAPDPDNGDIKLPPGFRALVVADNLGESKNRPRFLTVAANGDIYAKLFHDGLIALRDADGDGRAEVKQTFGSGNGTCVAIHDGWLYYSTTTGVYRYKYTPGELVPTGEPQTIVSGLPAGKQHDAKCFAFDDEGRLLVEVGSPYNVYSEPDRQFGAKGMDATEFLKTHGGFWRFDPNKLNQTQADGYHFSTGHRHSLAIAWNSVSKNFFMVMMGRDNLSLVDPDHYNDYDNAERVAEEMHVLREGINIGWPYTYYDPIKKARMVAPEFGGDNQKRAEPGKYDDPVIAFPGHWAPLQLAFYSGDQFPAKYRNGAFIAFHGSWNRAPLPQGGYKVCFIPFDDKGMPRGDYETFADGFSGINGDFTSSRDARFRPCGVAVGPDGSLYISDDVKGRIWRIIYTGETQATSAPAAKVETVTAPSTSLGKTKGAKLYAQTCAACHMPDGSGVPNMQPALDGNAIVAGDPATLVKVLLRGPAAVLPANREQYQNQMPPFAAWSDADLAAVSTFIRQKFGHGAGPVTTAQVAALRAAP
ncbi:MAG TPA: c-type cytochrome [Opitutaceae bacterium]|jgi:glucose/arabinose dehydrogenase/cytochrome c5|nr:c-type cytochrome [Opitutaceae bacterium]